MISLATSSAVRWTQDKHRGCSALPRAWLPTRARCEGVMTWGSPRLLSGNNWSDSPNCLLDCIRKEHFVRLVFWYDLTVLWLILKPGFHGWSIFFFFNTRGRMLNALQFIIVNSWDLSEWHLISKVDAMFISDLGWGQMDSFGYFLQPRLIF